MKGAGRTRGLALAAAGALFGAYPSQAQISHVTVRTPKSPVPPMVLVQTNAALGTTPPAVVSASRTPRYAVIYRPSLDKDELDRRALAFQKKRALEGSFSAQYELGVRYLKGEGVARDKVEARRWITFAANGGYSPAKRKLAELDREASGKAENAGLE